MNNLAQELNRVLAGTVVADLLSDFGRRLYFPKGIVAQSAEAKKHAQRLDATIGMATLKGQAMCLPSIRDRIDGLTPNQIFAYAPTAGVLQLREAWKQEMVLKNPSLEGKPTSLPIVVAGLTCGIFTVADLFLDSGESALIPDMFWGNYRLIVEERRQAQVATFPFFADGGGFNLQALEGALREAGGRGKAFLILNFPNNPTGYSPNGSEASALVRLLERFAREGLKILVVLDDAYFGLFYEENTYKQSLFAELAGLHPNLLAVKVDGPTKENLVWGFRLGFVTFAAPGLGEDHYHALTQKVMGAVRSSVSSSSQLAQSLMLKAMGSPRYRQEKEEAFRLLEQRYRRVREIVKRCPPVLKPLAFNSGYFMTFLLPGGRAEELRKLLLMERGIGVISIQDRYLRVAYSSVEVERLEELYGIIFAAAEGLLA